jgi:predicted nucleic acid-binding protein
MPQISLYGNKTTLVKAGLLKSEKKKMKTNNIDPNHLIVGSTIMAHRGILNTNNEKEFQNIKNLVITNWAK